MEVLTLTSPDFAEGGLIPIVCTGHGADRSPAFCLAGLRPDAVSLAFLLDDLDHPVPAYNHWVAWNFPPSAVFPGGIPAGEQVTALGGAVQGCGYGKHRYRGPKPPFHWSHRYRFQVFALDRMLTLPASARKRDLLAAMEGHVLQQAELTGHYR